MSKLVTSELPVPPEHPVLLTIDEKQVSVPEGTLVVDAAKKAGVYIPVFCYHPKMEPVGMCRMCLVEIGRPLVDRATGQVVRESDGSPKIQFGPKLETACTVPVSEGMVVRGFSDVVKRARKDILEFLLTSHPLDCPVCDKGGECPLQNLTMDFGPGQSRFKYEEKAHLAKHVPLGELIWLDRERCIQCARCIRFQEQIAGDPVIGFCQRGRSMQIITSSEPGFDSYFSGNTTDICPVGALTTADFRFGARPWEMNSAASLCPHCPVGCNLTLNVRREDKSGGEMVVKRVMPRQNEWVNELWICDKGRFAYHYTQSHERLTTPHVRKNGVLVPVSWAEALDLAAEGLRAAGQEVLTIASGRLSNEDLFNLHALTTHLGGKTALDTTMAGGDLVAQVGLGQGTNFSEMGVETVILVVACDLLEEAPLYWLRVKQAVQRGAKLIVVNPRPTRLDQYADSIIPYSYGTESATVLAFVNSLSAKRPDLGVRAEPAPRYEGSPRPYHSAGAPGEGAIEAAAKLFAGAANAIILFGSDGTGLEASQSLAQACANLLIATGHIGKANNGLIGVWQCANDQGAWDMGFRPQNELNAAIQKTKALYLVATDPCDINHRFDDDPSLAAVRSSLQSFIIVQELFFTETAKLADVVLPALPFTEREGTMTNAERRVQRYYPAIPPRAQARADYVITAELGKRLGVELAGTSDDLYPPPHLVMVRIAENIPDYAGVTYQKLAEVSEQWPMIGRTNLYYGGTSYENKQGLGVQLQSVAQRTGSMAGACSGLLQPKQLSIPVGTLIAVPVTRLYDRGQTLMSTELLQGHIPPPQVALHPADGAALKIVDGARVSIQLNGVVLRLIAHLKETVPPGFVLVPRSLGVTITGPTPIGIVTAEIEVIT